VDKALERRLGNSSVERITILTKEGESPVTGEYLLLSLSKTEHVLFCWKIGGSPSKPKYLLLTDSVQVP
jgi:hypothetical protein